MKTILFLFALLPLFSSAFAKDYQWAETQIKNQLTTDDVHVLSIKRDYFEIVTYMLYIYRIADGEHDYKVKLKVEDSVYNCSAVKYIVPNVIQLNTCYGGKVRLEEYMKDDVDFVRIKLKH